MSRFARTLIAVLILCGASRPSVAGEILNGYQFDQFSLPTADSLPFGITTGPDGNLWFTEDSGRIGRITPDGVIKEFEVPGRPFLITAGADGNLWFTDTGNSSIGRITPSGDATAFPLPTLGTAQDITTGPDGNVWFTLSNALSPSLSPSGVTGGTIGRITPGGTVSLFALDDPAFGIINGPDDALWYVGFSTIGRLTTGGQHRAFEVGPAFVQGITSGPDGALWFTSSCNLSLQATVQGTVVQNPCDYGVGRLTPDGMLTKFDNVSSDEGASAITRGPEDNLWFTLREGGVSRLTVGGNRDDIFLPSSPNDFGYSITSGPDGALWFTQPYLNLIGRLRSLALQGLNFPNSAVLGLAHGADDSIWFADAGGNRIGRINVNGSVNQHELGDGHYPTAVAVGPDGSGWFTNEDANTIGRITPQGDLIEFTIPLPHMTPEDIVLGPDGNFWFTLASSRIGRITPQGIIATFATPSADAYPQGIAVGPDGNLWFTEPDVSRIARMTTSGTAVDFPVPTRFSDPWDIAAGADGALYFTELSGGRIARITTDGVITELGVASPSSSPCYIALGPDGAMWFTEFPTTNILNVAAADPAPRPRIAEEPTPTPTPGKSTLGRLARDGRITRFDLPEGEMNPAGIAGRSDGRLFVALLDLSQIAYVDLAAAQPTRTATPRVQIPCHGDCDGDGVVSIAELISAVNIALGSAPPERCFAADIDHDGSVLINEIIAAVTGALEGCLPPP